MITDHQLKQILFTSEPHACSYLPGREARSQFTFAGRMPGELYERLLVRGFRRSGQMVYRPVCLGCQECQSIRVLAGEFQPDRSMRRAWRANQDLTIRVGRPGLTAEKRRLYHRYLELRHDRTEEGDIESFLYESPVETREIEFRLAGAIAAVAISDVVPSGLSAVYTYFDPDLTSRSLGTFAVLWQIEHCRRRGLPHCYLGYFVRDCRKMNYKNRFTPHEMLGADGEWRRGDAM